MPPVSTASPERTRHMLIHLLPAISAAIVGAAGCQDQPTLVRLPQTAADVVPQDTVLAPSADTYIRQGSPNQNQGTELILRLQSSGKNRVLLRWDQAALSQAAAGRTVGAARLELTIADLGDNWSAAGRTIELHRMTEAWTELGATWNCAVDSVPGNSRPECAGATAWDMDHAANYPFLAETTATALLRNGQSGVVSFDVTADVQAWLAGQPNDGWIVKKTLEGDPGKVDFGSRESPSPARLVITLAPADTGRPAVPPAFHFPADTTHFALYPSDSSVRYYRDLIVIQFQDSVSGDGVRAVFARFHAVIIGGLPEWPAYVVHVPDPGPTYEALDSLLTAVGQDPRVRLAFGVTFHGAYSPQVRFPNDGAGATRSDWVQSSGSLSPFLAVRSTLAWGCETGAYGGSPVAVSVVDLEFDASHPDLAGSLVSDEIPDTADIASLPALESDTTRSHGTMVAGVLTAQGDNDVGMAGLMWKTALYEYSMARGTAAAKDPVLYLGRFLRHASDAGVRVLVTSTYFGAATPQDVAAIDSIMSAFLSKGRGNLWVIAAGEYSPDFTLGSLQNAHGDIGTLVAAARLYTNGYRDHILFVGGTDRTGAKWGPSMDIQGATEIAAPAVQVLTLGDRTDFPSGTFTGDGTSLSAPMVAGVAAQLLAMDSTLSAREIKDYIVRGSRQPRMNPATGQMDPNLAVRVTGFKDQPYQLDAYGALTLLSAERPGTPICGYPVSVPSYNDADRGSVILEPAGVAPRRIPVPGASLLSAVSVAQGGRRLALVDYPDTAWRTIEMDQQGRFIDSISFVQRLYLEKEVVDVVQIGLHEGFIIHGDGPDTVADPIAPFLTADWGFGGDVAVSPTGSQVLFEIYNTGANECSGPTARAYLVPLAGGAATLVGELHTCDTTFTEASWSHDGRRAALVSQGIGVISSAITTVRSDGSSQQFPMPDVIQYGPRYLADDSLLQLGEETRTGCRVALRAADSPNELIAQRPGDEYRDCQWSYNTWVIPNAPPAGSAMTAAGGWRASPYASAATGFSLRGPAARLQLGLARARPRWGFSRTVQVN